LTYDAAGLIPPLHLITVGPLPLVRANQAVTAPQQGDTFASHQLIWLAAMGRVPVPRDVAKIIQGAAARQASTPMVTGSPAEGSAKRRSIDGWLFLRPDAELRATRGAVTTEIRLAVFAVTEFPPVELPLGLRGETYLAGGYAGGDFATPFADG
jgi:hypothetical protein